MFSKILIANRGEIACRVIRSARKMGIKTVAVYSSADAGAPHVRMADEAIYLGPPAAAESYLRVDKILEAIKATGAEAVHPGYGFLSERASFAQALADAGVAFIGPPVRAIQAMGDKIESKKLAAEAGVSTVPGMFDLIEGPDHAAQIAAQIGYPVMIKASAGGGGKGMRIAWNDAEAREGFELSRNEAKASFGDDRIFIEKFVQRPRHIEIQLLGDQHGNIVYLNERECSIQRRNQKVVEEAPSPFLDAETRKAMGEQAVALARAVGYYSAGTVECIVDPDKNFYFLEMNTRLQVEHPVTELITGVDLVEEMIRVAAGEKLRFSQAEVKLNGWAVESRIYAEDPYRNFLPSVGRLKRYRPPQEGKSVDGSIIRNDTGVEEGGEVSIYYDPMIAKLCTWAPTRGKAVDAMQTALDSFEIEGLGHNIPFLQAVMLNEKFRTGDLSTAFIAQEFPEGFHGVTPSPEDLRGLAEAGAALHAIREERAAKIEGAMRGHERHPPKSWVTSVGGQRFPLTLTADTSAAEGETHFRVRHADGVERGFTLAWTPGQSLARLRPDSGPEATIKVEPKGDGFRLRRRGADLSAITRTVRADQLAQYMIEKPAPDFSRFLLCPMPGLLTSLKVAEGEEVQEGQALASVEAMKMENVLRAEKKAVVKSVKAKIGESLAVDQVILEFE